MEQLTVVGVGMAERTDATVSFDVAFAEEYPQMVRLATALCGDVGLAEEVTQEAFAAAWRHWASLERPGAYVRRAVINGVTDAGRRSRRTERRDRSLRVVAATEVAPPDDPLWDVLDRLPDTQRQAVVLRYYADLTVPEIAELTGRPLGTTKSDLHRALRTLAEELDR